MAKLSSGRPWSVAPSAEPSPTSQRAALLRDLRAVVGAGHVLDDPYDLRLYEYDAYIERITPVAVVLPATAEEVVGVVEVCRRHGVPYTPRGAGTGLSGGAIPSPGGVVVSLTRMNRILAVDLDDLLAVVEPGVVNLHLNQVVARWGLSFAPDPSSQRACTIGGNVAENAGGPHTLRYGVTTNHVLGLEVVLPTGDLVWLGGRSEDRPGYDLRGVMVGSEGTLGIVTKAVVRLIPLAEAVKTLLAIFQTLEEATDAVSRIIADGVVPAALEMLDDLSLRVVEEFTHAGYPLDAGAVLLIEVDGLAEAMDPLAERVAALCFACGAREVRQARTAAERDLLWKGRKSVFSAYGRISQEYYTLDGVVPRHRLPEAVARMRRIAEEHGVLIAHVFHAGDGNMHPVLFFNSRNDGELDRVRRAGAEILRVCAELGGTLSGEHGIGVEKLDYLSLVFDEADLQRMTAVKAVLDPLGLSNPGKLLPTPGRCVELVPRPKRSVGW
ncbi:MAG TPA: FAD-linked oxidase C-terminal domain-containing protein [Chloroflexota bacterium]